MIKFVFSTILFFLIPFTALAEKAVFDQSVLVIHSYHKDMQWVEEVHRGLKYKILKSLGDSVDIKVEYMDSKRYIDDAYYELLVLVWRSKYLNNKPDCLIVCDDNALNLILSLRAELFKDVPIVFCGINHYDPQRFSSYKDITGVVEAYDLPGTLDLIKTLLPDNRKLFIINDDTTTGRANKQRLEAMHYDYADHFNFMYSGRLSISDLQASVKNLGEEHVILLMSYNRDAEDKILRYRDTVRAIRESSSRPIFGVWSFYLGRGIVGGSLVNGSSIREKAAELCLKILKGMPAGTLPVISISPNLPMFDNVELERFSISKNLLPPGSVIKNRPNSLWYQYKKIFSLGVALFLGQFLVIALLVYNIRKRRTSEQQLQKNQHSLAITLEAIGDGVISVDEHYRIVRVNPSASRLLEMPSGNLSGKQLLDLLVELDPSGGRKLADIITRCFDSGSSIEFPNNTTLVLSGRAEKHLSGICSPMRDSFNRIIGAVLICRDITEKETMQAMLAQSRKMEAIGQLAGGVAHDFNNLLTGISGFAELLSLQLQDDKIKRETTSKIINAAGRAKDLTRQLLSFARKGKIISSPVNCHESLASAIGLLERSIDKNITLQSELDAQDAVIVGDPVQLENIFLNLGINGADAMLEGGDLTFSTVNEQIVTPVTCEFGEILEPGAYLCVSVKDTGCGITKEARQKIFEPFYTTKENGKGTGLGLSAVFGAMKEHDGRIRIFTDMKTGTKFQLFFGVGKLHKNTSSEIIKPLRGSNETILIIDDDQLILSSIDGLLTELGYTVLLAEGGRRGVEIYRERQEDIDVVLLDMIMPEMDGVSTFRALKQINSDIKVIISSGFAKTAKVSEVEELGVCGYLQKPYTAAEVSNAIKQALAL